MTRVADLAGAELALWVARASGYTATFLTGIGGGSTYAIELHPTFFGYIGGDYSPQWAPYEDWAQGGPIIEQNNILVDCVNVRGEWSSAVAKGRDFEVNGKKCAEFGYGLLYYGPTPLIAAMRAYVASVFGESVPEVAP